jgi:hypothetical protein
MKKNNSQNPSEAIRPVSDEILDSVRGGLMADPNLLAADETQKAEMLQMAAVGGQDLEPVESESNEAGTDASAENELEQALNGVEIPGMTPEQMHDAAKEAMRLVSEISPGQVPSAAEIADLMRTPAIGDLVGKLNGMLNGGASGGEGGSELDKIIAGSGMAERAELVTLLVAGAVAVGVFVGKELIGEMVSSNLQDAHRDATNTKPENRTNAQNGLLAMTEVVDKIDNSTGGGFRVLLGAVTGGLDFKDGSNPSTTRTETRTNPDGSTSTTTTVVDSTGYIKSQETITGSGSFTGGKVADAVPEDQEPTKEQIDNEYEKHEREIGRAMMDWQDQEMVDEIMAGDGSISGMDHTGAAFQPENSSGHLTDEQVENTKEWAEAEEGAATADMENAFGEFGAILDHYFPDNGKTGSGDSSSSSNQGSGNSSEEPQEIKTDNSAGMTDGSGEQNKLAGALDGALGAVAGGTAPSFGVLTPPTGDEGQGTQMPADLLGTGQGAGGSGVETLPGGALPGSGSDPLIRVMENDGSGNNVNGNNPSASGGVTTTTTDDGLTLSADELAQRADKLAAVARQDDIVNPGQ